MYRAKVELILASSSPRRRELLGRLGVKFTVISPASEEDSTISGAHKKDPRIYVQECSRKKIEKAVKLVKDRKGCWVISADTVVVLDDKVIGKPKDREEARHFLNLLSGRWHQVITGYCLFNPDTGKRLTNTVVSDVGIRKLSEAEIESYLSIEEPYDKAGAYAAQGIGACLIEAVKGSYTNVVGLPLAELVTDLLHLELIEPVEQS